MPIQNDRVFHDAIQYTLAEGIYAISKGEQTPASRAYVQYLRLVKSDLAGITPEGFGDQFHEYLQETLERTLVDVEREGEEGTSGAISAQFFLTGYAEAVHDLLHVVEETDWTTVSFDARPVAVAFGTYLKNVLHVFDGKPHPLGRAHSLFAHGLHYVVEQTLAIMDQAQNPILIDPLLRVLRNESDLIEAQLRQAPPPPGCSRGHWVATVEIVRDRMRAWLSGANHLVSMLHPVETKRQEPARSIKAGCTPERILRSRIRHLFLAVHEAIGVLRSLTYRGHAPGALDAARELEELWQRFLQGPANTESFRLIASQLRKENAWLEAGIQFVLGHLDGRSAARRLVVVQTSVAEAWKRSLLAALPTTSVEGVDLAVIMNGIDYRGFPDTPCGHGDAHGLAIATVQAISQATGQDIHLPKRPDVAYVIGFLWGHHQASLPHEPPNPANDTGGKE